MQRPVINTETGSNPGAPLAWGSPENPDDAVAGYGYVPCDTSEVEETFYYHSDHLGSTSYITDQQANVTQYDAYLPYGELLVDEHSSSADLPYKFNGKELDEETGLYYYGARYMNPVTSMWYGVDLLAEKYPNVSVYVYCHGNPIKLIDPNGLDGEYYMNYQGFWSSSYQGFGEYIGNVKPETSSYYELVRIKGTLYHKNTTNVFSMVGNYLGGNFVNKKAYNPADESFNKELVEQGGLYVVGSFAIKGIGMLGKSTMNLLRKSGGSIWNLNKYERGFVYEKMLNIEGTFSNRGCSNYPVIDAFCDGVATSIKTIDVKAKTYQVNNALFRTLKKYVNDLSAFKPRDWGNINLKGTDIRTKVLEVGIPKGATKTQIEQINKAVEYAHGKGVQLNVRVVK